MQRSSPLRSDLVAAAARLIAGEGTGALTLRRVAQEVGTSTMAVYTHLGGMGELRRAVRWEGFSRLAAELAAQPASEDPVEHLARLCVAYYGNGIANPELYRVMFMETTLDEHDAEVCAGTFETLVAGVRECIRQERFAPADPVALATELWVAGHGLVTLQLSGALPAEAALDTLAGVLAHLLGAFGAEAAAETVAAAVTDLLG